MLGETATDRRLIDVSGADALPFLQGLVSNDVRPLGKGPGLVWAALLSPQGKYLADFFIVQTGAIPRLAGALTARSKAGNQPSIGTGSAWPI
jgi:folate-binding Fe-S cluster repair protein YgfZ